MGPYLVQLASVLGLSLASGINLYATVAVVGLVTKFDLIRGLPPEFQAFNNDVVITVALVLYVCEFLADKIPAFDSLWDTVHTAIRPFGAALIAVTVVGDATPAVQIIAGLVGASLGLATHAAKAGTRLVVNTSPEPFSNIALSLGEDAGVVGGTVLVLAHPYISLGVSVLILALLVIFGPGLARAALLVLRAVPARIAAFFTRGAAEARLLPDRIEETVDRELREGETVRAAGECWARKVRRCGWNRKGWLVLTDRRLVLVWRRLFRTRTTAWEVASLSKPGIERRLLVDALRVKTGDRFVNFLFLKTRSREASDLRDGLAAAVGETVENKGLRAVVAPVGEAG